MAKSKEKTTRKTADLPDSFIARIENDADAEGGIGFSAMLRRIIRQHYEIPQNLGDKIKTGKLRK